MDWKYCENPETYSDSYLFMQRDSNSCNTNPEQGGLKFVFKTEGTGTCVVKYFGVPKAGSIGAIGRGAATLPILFSLSNLMLPVILFSAKHLGTLVNQIPVVILLLIQQAIFIYLVFMIIFQILIPVQLFLHYQL